MADLLLLLGATVTVVYALFIATALIRNTFSSLRALSISFFLSAVATIPFVGAMALRWPYRTELKSLETTPHILTLVNAIVLVFVWVAPSIQWLRSKPGAAPRQASNERHETFGTGPGVDQ